MLAADSLPDPCLAGSFYDAKRIAEYFSELFGHPIKPRLILYLRNRGVVKGKHVHGFLYSPDEVQALAEGIRNMPLGPRWKPLPESETAA